MQKALKEKVKLLPKPEYGEKKCKVCGIVKSYDAFSLATSSRDGRVARCRECKKRCPIVITARHDPERSLKTRLNNYGMVPQDFFDMLDKQNNKCECCGCDLMRPYIDHNHSTGAVRGVLCCMCNTGLAYIERPGFAENATRYLDRHAGQEPRFKIAKWAKKSRATVVARVADQRAI